MDKNNMDVLQDELKEYITLVNYKDRYIMSMKKECEDLKNTIAQLQNTIAQLQNECSLLELELTQYKNLKVVRLRSFVLRVINKIKHCLKIN